MLLAMAAVLVGTLALQASPAMADDLNRSDADLFDDHRDIFDIDHDIGDLEFLDFDEDFGFASDVDVDFEEVPEDSDLEDECLLTDIEGDGDLEFTCFVEDDD